MSLFGQGCNIPFPTMVTGIIADKVFGYRGAVGREADPTLQVMNATALGNSLLAVLGVPWLLCFIAYFRAQPHGDWPPPPEIPA